MKFVRLIELFAEAEAAADGSRPSRYFAVAADAVSLASFTISVQFSFALLKSLKMPNKFSCSLVFSAILLLFAFRSLFYTKVGRVPILFISFKYLIKATNGQAYTHTHPHAYIHTHTHRGGG